MPDLNKENLPICKICGNKARPHILFFDEPYEEKFYLTDTLRESIANMDCLILMGTTMETSLTANIAMRALEKGIVVVEINPEPVIADERAMTIKERSEDVIVGLCDLIYK